MRKISFSLIAAVLFLLGSQISITTSSATAEGFKDVKSSDWFYSSVASLVQRGIVNGFSDGTFKPKQTVTRAELIKMAVTALKLDVAERKEGQSWYVPYVEAAKTAGVYTTKDFAAGWDKPITRLETARIAVRAVDRSLRDAKDTELMYEATKRGLITGVANGELGKDESSTRAQAVVIIDRVLQALAGQTLKMDKRAASYAEVELRGTNMETMWGGKMNDLPQKHSLYTSITGTFEQILIIDLEDSESPYRSWATTVKKINGVETNKDYLVAFKIVLENTKVTPKGFFYFNNLASAPHFMDAYIPLNKEKPSPFGQKKYILQDTLNKITTWDLQVISKDKLSDFKKSNMALLYFTLTNGKDIDLAPKGKIFGK
ncbi:hypothetical protein PAECIP111893_04741 [Paenibacillus plantiphilus]|uniref:SLH domain-containing protein n=1 Tax=Paenibacillus plantiphilus TaxID=2905650 RepID=A0ABM9CQQ5_9BACL|nr:S-layer homology domain-containing protein [Paenibacillus plantiphilus]CAH1221605.1 hypothetical protein PAECIP111893_04741 [Paenibacillus plantiphilus]